MTKDVLIEGKKVSVRITKTGKPSVDQRYSYSIDGFPGLIVYNKSKKRRVIQQVLTDKMLQSKQELVSSCCKTSYEENPKGGQKCDDCGRFCGLMPRYDVYWRKVLK